MITNWRISHSDIDHKPLELDTTSSTSVVYERRNFRQITTPSTMEGEEPTKQWEYEEREIPRSEYTAAILAAEKMELKQESDIIDRYTEELMEGGLL